MTELKLIGIFRDGGTCDYVDDDGNGYHLYQSMMKSETKEGGKLYVGSLIEKLPPQLAKGKFKLNKTRGADVPSEIIIEQ